MPWNARNFAKHCKGLTPVQYARGAKVANAVLAETGNEGYAVRAGINAAKGRRRKRPTLTPAPIDWRPPEVVEHGGFAAVPVLKAKG